MKMINAIKEYIYVDSGHENDQSHKGIQMQTLVMKMINAIKEYKRRLWS